MNVIKHRPKAMELALVQAGYTLADIRGEREVHTYEEQPSGWQARLGSVTPRSALLLAAGALALGGMLAYETAMLSPVVVSLLVAYGLHALGEVDPDPLEVEHEVQGRLIQWQEWQRMEKEQQEREARKARQTGGH